MLLEDNPFMEGNLRTLDWMKGSIILGLVGLLLGCATSEDVQILDSDVYQLKSQIHKVEKESDSLKKEIELYQRETQKGFPVLQAETKRLQSNLSLQLENLQSDLQAETKKLQSNLSLQLENLQSDLQAETKKLQSNLSLQLENLQSELKVIQKEKDILQNGLIVLQKEVQRDISTLQNMDNLLRTDLTKETQKLHADLILHFQTLQSEIQKFSIGVEEYKEFLMKVSRETDRLRKDITLRTELLEGSKKTLEEKNKAQDDQTKVLNERVKGMDDRIKGLEDRSKGLEDRSKGLEDRSKGLEDRSKGLEERSKGLEDRSKGLEERSKSLEERIKGMDEKIGRVVSKQGELEKSISAKEVSIGVKGFTTGAGDLYKEAYESFQKGDLEGAQKKLEAFLKQYPNTELSDNAQFWIGETYYLKKDFEKAILEYEKAIAKYPEGDKIPAALFKQALAFLELGDKTNAKSLLKRVIERYPHSDQAEIAKKKLEEIK